MIDKMWDFLEDLDEAAGGPVGVLMGFVLPFAAMVIAFGCIVGWWQ